MEFPAIERVRADMNSNQNYLNSADLIRGFALELEASSAEDRKTFSNTPLGRIIPFLFNFLKNMDNLMRLDIEALTEPVPDTEQLAFENRAEKLTHSAYRSIFQAKTLMNIGPVGIPQHPAFTGMMDNLTRFADEILYPELSASLKSSLDTLVDVSLAAKPGAISTQFLIDQSSF